MTDVLPAWDLDALFPGLRSRRFSAAREAVGAELDRLVALFDRAGVAGGPPRAATDDDRVALAEVIQATNEVLEQLEPVEAYLHGLVTTDARDDDAAAEVASLQADLVALDVLRTRLDAWVGRLGASELAGAVDPDYRHLLERAEAGATHQMGPAEEGLLAELRLSGSTAWARLAGDLGATLTGTVDGEAVPVTVLRAMATDPDRGRRRRAHEAEVAAWATIGTPMAACLNGVKGEAATVARRRGWPDALEPALRANGVERRALEAMQAAATARFPDFRRYLRAKAHLVAPDEAARGLAWWDLAAPLPGTGRVDWAAATAAVEAAFAGYSPALGAHARRAVAGRWVDAAPRAAKRGGAYCMPVGRGASRIMLNFDGSWDGVQTLAHELGHAYHNAVLAPRPALQRATPMALAETASIFCETIVVEAALAAADPAGRLALLDVDLLGATQTVVDIHSRFLFEAEVMDRRRGGPLSVAELNDAMTRAQVATYGDGLDRATLHPWMWAVKPHYYSAELGFYNWPYCFGLLFGLGLHARFREDPATFRAGYDDLLASTGTSSAAELARRFDIDLADGAFWAASLDVVAARIDEYTRLATA